MQPLMDLFFPPRCLHCDKVLPGPEQQVWLCQGCRQQLKPLPLSQAKALVLDRLETVYLEHLLVGWEFTPEIRSLVHHLKYQKMPGLGIWLGSRLANRFACELNRLDHLKILPVPLHPIRQREREYNQSLQIARGLVQTLPKLCLLAKGLQRIRATVSQTGLNRQQRRENVTGAFALAEGWKPEGANLLLVDDVVTTGATLNECARVLKAAGASRVWGIAVATPPLDES